MWCSTWLIHTPKEFFVNAGIAQSVLFAGVLCWIASRLLIPQNAGISKSAGDFVVEQGTLLSLSLFAGVLLLDLSGLIRCESTRLFLFFMPFLQMTAAWACCQFLNQSTIAIVLASTILQTAVTISTVSFLPWRK